ncbi:DUF438 domain-containing protein [Candidatus Thorarchaeota archaeon]|nr:MAG: DUF438 domain-containing protein [Candidatus Thorarchaeota archaeon]
MTDNKAVLKEIIERLHKGESPDNLKKEFVEVLDATSAEEISRAEEELIREGMPREKVRKLCDVHLAVFRESLDMQDTAKPVGHPIHTLKQEHQILLDSAEELERLGQSMMTEPEDIPTERLARVRHLVKHFRDSESHYFREENVLFPYLEKHGVKEPPAIMWMEHDTIREIEGALYGFVEGADETVIKNASHINSRAKRLRETLSSHFYKENNILFPTAIKVITDEEWDEIVHEFADIGYCCFTPTEAKLQVADERDVQGTIGEEGMLELPTGAISLTTLEAMLNTLPLDITFVDADNKVRYFSDSQERIFVRSKAVIGREVQLCHPQKSVHVVNRILNEFRDGDRDSAEFWIELGGNTIYIRYFAVRDKNGEYLGCLEVTQDITKIKSLQGQKRLLD